MISKLKIILLVSFVFNIANMLAQDDLKKQVEKLENQVASPFKRSLNAYILGLDTLSIKEIKAKLEKNALNNAKEKNEFIKNYNLYKEFYNKELNEVTKQYNTNEEELEDYLTLTLGLVNDHHLQFKQIMQDGILFEQRFDKSYSNLELIFGDKLTISKEEKGLFLSGYLLRDIEIENTIEKIYYYDKTDDKQRKISFRDLIKTEKKRVDSVAMKFTLNYRSKVDSIIFTKNDIGKKKNGIKLVKMENNIMQYLTKRSNNSKDLILREIGLNKEGKQLQSKLNSFLYYQDAEELYKNLLKNDIEM